MTERRFMDWENTELTIDASGVRSVPSGFTEAPLITPEIWANIFEDSVGSDSGISVTAEKALSLGAVHQAVWRISGDIAKMPVMQYELATDPKSVRRRLPDDPLTKLVSRKPNREMNAFKFWRRVMVHALIWSNAWVYIDRDLRGNPIELVPLLPDRTWHERVDGKLWVVTESNARLVPIEPADVFHIEGLCWDGMEAPTLIKLARQSWGLGLAQQRFASKFFKNGGRVGGILELPVAMSKPARDTVEEGFRKTYEGTDNPFLTVVLRDNAKFHAGQFSPRDAQMVEVREQEVREIARWFNLAPSKLGLSDSVSYNSKTEDNQDYLDSTLSIWLEQIEDELDAKLLAEDSRRFFEFDTSTLLRMNETQRLAAYQTGIASRIYSPNECRYRENLEPYEGGDEFVNPNTMKDGSPTKPADEPPTEPAADEPADAVDTGDAATRHALSRVVFHVGSHARHRAERGGKSYIEWIDGGLKTHCEEARKLLGSETIVVSMLGELRTAAEKATETNLIETVEAVITKFEQQAIQGVTYGTS